MSKRTKVCAFKMNKYHFYQKGRTFNSVTGCMPVNIPNTARINNFKSKLDIH